MTVFRSTFWKRLNLFIYFPQLTQQKHEENQRQLEEIYASEMESKQRKLAALRSLANSPDVSSRNGSGPRPPVAPKPVMRSRLGGTGGQATPGTSMVRRLRQNFSPPPPHANQRYQVSLVLNQNVEFPWSPHEMIACTRVEGCNHRWGSIIGVSHAIIIG